MFFPLTFLSSSYTGVLDVAAEETNNKQIPKPNPSMHISILAFSNIMEKIVPAIQMDTDSQPDPRSGP